MKIYLSGPITGTLNYLERFSVTEAELISKGHEVINPAKVNAQLPKNTTHEQYMSLSYVMLDMADAIYMMSGWEKSKGACMEYKYSLSKGKMILGINIEDDCLSHLNKYY